MPPDERMLLERVTEQVLLGPNRSPSSEMSARLCLHIQEGACCWPASEINRPQLLLGQQERRKHHRDQRPKKKKLGHFVFSTSKLRSGQQIAFGRQSAPGRRFALGPAKRVRPAIRVRPTASVWPGKARLASKARFTSRIRTMLHQQGDSPPANALTTSKPTSQQLTRSPNAPIATAGECQRENKQALTALRRRR